MNSLQTVQKTFRVFGNLAKAAMIITFVAAGLAGLALLLGIALASGATMQGVDAQLLCSLTETSALTEMIGALLAELIIILTDGILLVFACRYFKLEQAEGTPFTEQGAEQIKKLGIRTMVMTLVAAILAAVVYGVFDVPSGTWADWSNAYGIAVGVVLILISLIFRYGAQLEKACSQSEHSI